MKKLFRSHKEKAATESLLLSLNKIQNLIFYLLTLFLPTQLGRHFWPDFSFVKGIRVDYLSPTLYATDILIILIFIIWVIEKFKGLSNRHSGNSERSVEASRIGFWTSQNDKKRITPKLQIIFFSAILIGILLSKSPQAGVYGLLKLLEFIFLGFYTAQNISKFKLENILLMFAIGIIFESFLSISQYFNHGSINGIFYFFGERFFTSLTPGIANASLGGELFLRPYGTFPHPNVLAGYFIIAMAMIISNLKSQISNMKKILYCTALLIGTIALFLTLSRVAILLWVLILGLIFVKRFIKTKFKISIFHVLLSIFALGVTSFLLVNSPLRVRFINLNLSDESIVQREGLVQSSIAMIKDHPFFGVGLNNFLVNLPSYQIAHTPLFYLQPVHNIFILIATETGIIGFSFFVWFLIKIFSRIKNHESRIKGWSMIHNSLFIILSSVLILGMFDHYFLTLQQGQLLFAFTLGLCWAKSSKR